MEGLLSMPDHMQYLCVGVVIGVGIPFFIAGIALHLAGFKMVICKDSVHLPYFDAVFANGKTGSESVRENLKRWADRRNLP